MTPPAPADHAAAPPPTDARLCLASASVRRLRWDGRPPVSPGWFEMRPPGLTRDTRPLYDEDLDCVVGYYRCFGHRGYVYDLLGEIISIAYRASPDPVPSESPFLVVGSLWRHGVRSLTRTGYDGIGADHDTNSLAALRDRLHGLSRLTLRFAPEALAAMHDPDRFVPLHMLRLAIRLGVRSPCGSGVPGIYHYRAPMTRRWVPQLVHVSIREDDCTLLRLGFGTGRHSLCERC